MMLESPRVAPRVFLLLGALMQTPDGRMERAHLAVHLAPYVPVTDLSRLIDRCEGCGLIVYDPTTRMVRLTDKADLVRRQGGRPRIVPFMRYIPGKQGRS